MNFRNWNENEWVNESTKFTVIEEIFGTICVYIAFFIIMRIINISMILI